MAKVSQEVVKIAEQITNKLVEDFRGHTPHRNTLLSACADEAVATNNMIHIEYIKRHAESVIVHYMETGRRIS